MAVSEHSQLIDIHMLMQPTDNLDAFPNSGHKIHPRIQFDISLNQILLQER